VTGITVVPEPSGWQVALTGLVVAGIGRVYGTGKMKKKGA
jgi:hypothetical protein